jgi:hypothetical protein
MDVGDSDGDSSTPEFVSGFPVDAGLVKQTNGTGDFFLLNRLNQGATLYTNLNSAETTSGGFAFDYSNGFYGGSRNADYQAWMWKRAPGFFDVVAYTGNGTAGRTVSHNLGVVPEMMWVKKRDTNKDWGVYAIGLETPSLTASHYHLHINQDFSSAGTNMWHDTQPTSSEFYLGTDTIVNESAATYIAYLFATVPGVSKVGSVSHTNGTDTNVDCGFSSGARFILLKRTDGASSWYVWDTARGIVAGDDKVLYLQSTLSEQVGDSVDPLSSGFTMVGGSFDTGSYIFYAIA